MSAVQIVRGFVAGFVATLVFHQVALLILHLAGIVPATPWNLSPVPPLGVPAVISAAFWGGVWGIILALLAPGLGRGAGYWIGCVLFGAVALTLVAWFVVGPLKGRPPALAWPGVIVGPIVNGAWGFGTALLLRLLPGRRPGLTPPAGRESRAAGAGRG